MYLRFIGLLLLVPLVDVLLLVVLATGIGPITLGPAATVAIVVLTALLGLLLVRAEGRHTVRKIQRQLARGEPPTNALLDGAFLLVAGALMLTPGLITDLIGLLLVLPPTRYPIRVAVKRYVVTPYLDSETGGFATGNVYIGGFPSGDGENGGFRGGFGGASGPGSDPGRPGDGTETVDVGADDYEFEDVSTDESAESGDFDGTSSDGGDDSFGR
ncbi:MAG: FxsA family protein [Halobacteriota archaeon]|uniref:FxsA family protein n=1 Tax=Natronomonas sp. TaxID=2184060 RepID=UPI0039766FA0